MRQELSRVGGWVAGAGLTAVFGYLIATAPAGGRHPAWPYFLFGAIVILGLVLYFTGRRGVRIEAPQSSGGPSGSSSPQSAPVSPLTPSGRFTGLRDGSKVGHQELVSGIVTGLPSDTQPWILVRPVSAPAYWPQHELLLDPNGGFRSVAYFGQSARKNSGEEFIVLLALAAPPVSAQFRDFLKAPHGDMQDLPQDVRILDQVNVIRR